jgi:hypothetical protein
VATNIIQKNITLMLVGSVLVAATMVASGAFDGYGSAGTARWINKDGNVVKGNAIVVVDIVVIELDS